MSKGQLKTQIGWAVFAIAAMAFQGCAVDTSEPYPEEFEQEEPAVVTGQSLDPSSMGRPESSGTDDGPGGKHETQDSTSGLSTDEEEEPDPDPWQIPSLPGGDGDDDGSSGEDPP